MIQCDELVVAERLYAERVSRGPAFLKGPRFSRARVSREPDDCWQKTAPPSSFDLPFEPIDLLGCDITSLVSQSDIDHSIGPVPHTPGGSVAGYLRWQAFKKDGLSTRHPSGPRHEWKCHPNRFGGGYLMSFGLPLAGAASSRRTSTPSVVDLRSPNLRSKPKVVFAGIPTGTDLWKVLPRPLPIVVNSMTGCGSVPVAIGVPGAEWRVRS